MLFQTLEEMIVESARVVRPPERLSVSEAATRYRKLNNPGSYVGPWDNLVTPYMIEPMDELNSYDYTGWVFVGPAQCAKTDIGLNWVTHTAMCDPSDMMFVHPSQAAARDFAKRRIERLFRHSKDVGAAVIPGRNNQNIYDTRFLTGWMLTQSWPTINELSGKPLRRLWLTDYDRMPESVDHEGSPFDLSRKRATTFKQYGMTAAESSPGWEIEDAKAMPKSAHEAPPSKGILALYNRGDRRRYYWRCPFCGSAFEPDFKLLVWPDTRDIIEAAEFATMACPHCNVSITHEPDEKNGIPGKHQLNVGGRWVKDGMVWMPDGRIVGKPYRSDICSFWLKGVAAAFADWKTLVTNYLKAMEEYQRTGSQEALKTTVNVDQGLPFDPFGLGDERLPETLKNTARDFGEKIVPAGVRFLVASIDVQKSKFVVQVHGFGVGGDIGIIDRFDVKKSKRLDDDGEHYMVNPGSYPEDWHVLVDEVMTKTYPLDLPTDAPERRMQIRLTVCDSGGRTGVTANAYAFYRWLRDECPGLLHRRFQLVKGDNRKAMPRVQIVYPDSERKDRHAGARGEIPVLIIDTNAIKDQVDKMLGRKVPGGGMVHFPVWLPDEFYSEMTVERKTAKGWENPKKLRNEAWDLICYALAGALSRHIGIELIDWERPPSWAADWDRNDLVFEGGNNSRFEIQRKGDYDLTKLAEDLA